MVLMGINLESDAFMPLKDDVNAALQQTLAGMLKHDYDEATVTLKIKLSLVSRMLRNQTEARMIKEPKFSHDVTTAIQLKEKRSGMVDSKDYELVFDEAIGEFFMQSTAVARQTTIFDEDGDRHEDEAPIQLPAGNEGFYIGE